MKIRLNMEPGPAEKPAGSGQSQFSLLTPNEGTQAESGGAQDQPKRVLIVDDDPLLLKITSARLSKAGFQVTTATDCAEAISSVAEKKPEVIVLDVNFPPDITNGAATSWDGFQLMYWLRSLQNTRDTRFVVISGNDSKEFKDRARSAGALGFLAKPIDHEQLLETIRFSAKPVTGTGQSRRWWVCFFDLL